MHLCVGDMLVRNHEGNAVCLREMRRKVRPLEVSAVDTTGEPGYPVLSSSTAVRTTRHRHHRHSPYRVPSKGP
jgi:hypothetical protein